MHGTKTAIVLLSGLTVVGALAGCSAASLTTTAASAGSKHGVSNPADVLPVPTQSSGATPTPTAAPIVKTVVKPPVVHHVAPPKPKPRPKPKPPPPSPGYNDGTYGADGSYVSPGGTETLHVSLTLSANIITSLTVTSVHVDPTAATYEAQFIGGVNAVVVGRNIASADVGAIAGSSLTARGFNAALASIRAQAKK